jgi:murein DD-endopeptidase MepM/ murein hydrolase activator NlpD
MRGYLVALLLGCISLRAELFQLPTANRALYEPNGEEKFFAPTPGKDWRSGTFGCVRSDGGQLHEGLDIRSIQHDKRGEPVDPVMVTADGTVAYINRKSGLSNYGNYIVVKHIVEGMEIYSLYAHLSEVRDSLKPGQPVKTGEVIATMGRTSNTSQRIGQDRAHVHFELNLFVSENFPAWYRKHFPDQHDDHGQWNGQNLLGLDPREILLAQKARGEKFHLLEYIQNQTELCRVLVRQVDFPWVKRYRALLRSNPVAEKNGPAAYELVLNFNGIPFQIIPRAASEVKGTARYQLLEVNEAEQKKNPCRHLIVQRGKSWQLTEHGIQLLDLLTWRASVGK